MAAVDVAHEYAIHIAAAGIRATTDPRNLNPPCVLFLPPSRISMDLGCGGSAEMRCLLIVGGPGTGDAWEQLDGLLGDVLRAEILPVQAVVATSFDAGSEQLPAYELSWLESIDLY